MRTRLPAGFTLPEMLATLAVASILVTTGLPAFTEAIRQGRASADANTVLAQLTLARSEAIKRNRRVALCRTSDGTRCAAAGRTAWDRGVLTYVDLDCDGALDAAAVTTDCHGAPIAATSEPVLRAEIPLSPASAITVSASLADGLSYRASGLSGADAGHFLIKPGTDFRTWRKVVLNIAGRPYVTRCANATCT